MSRTLALIAALALVPALAACGGGGTSGPKAPKEAAVEDRDAEQGAKDLVAEVYETLEHGSTDSFFSLLADPIVVFGPRRTDGFATRTALVVELRKLLDPKTKKHVPAKSGALAVVASPGGHSAWAIDTVTLSGEQYAVTAILSNTGGLWNVAAASIARTPPLKAFDAAVANDSLVPTGATLPPKIAPGAAAAADRFKKSVADPAALGAELASHAESALVGPAAGELTRGKKGIEKGWKALMELHSRAAINGDVAAGVTGDGQLAWVSAGIARATDGAAPVALRAFAIYANDAGNWQLVALQESAAVDAPGAGAAFKKILPPPPPKAVAPPPAPPDEPPPVTAKKGKKSKKKPAKAVEPEVKVEADLPPEPKKKRKFSKRSDMSAAGEDEDAPKKKKKHASDDDAPADEAKHEKKHVVEEEDAPKVERDDSTDDAPPPPKKKKHEKRPKPDDDE